MTHHSLIQRKKTPITLTLLLGLFEFFFQPVLAQTPGTTVTFTGEVTPEILAEQSPTLTSTLVAQTDRLFSQTFMNYLEVVPKNNLTPLELLQLLAEINRATGHKIYLVNLVLSNSSTLILKTGNSGSIIVPWVTAIARIPVIMPLKSALIDDNGVGKESLNK